jgi:hypothetical protein
MARGDGEAERNRSDPLDHDLRARGDERQGHDRRVHEAVAHRRRHARRRVIVEIDADAGMRPGNAREHPADDGQTRRRLAAEDKGIGRLRRATRAWRRASAA